MPVEAKPLFRLEILRPRFMGFHPPDVAANVREIVARWSLIVEPYRWSCGDLGAAKLSDLLIVLCRCLCGARK